MTGSVCSLVSRALTICASCGDRDLREQTIMTPTPRKPAPLNAVERRDTALRASSASRCSAFDNVGLCSRMWSKAWRDDRHLAGRHFLQVQQTGQSVRAACDVAKHTFSTASRRLVRWFDLHAHLIAARISAREPSQRLSCPRPVHLRRSDCPLPPAGASRVVSRHRIPPALRSGGGGAIRKSYGSREHVSTGSKTLA